MSGGCCLAASTPIRPAQGDWRKALTVRMSAVATAMTAFRCGVILGSGIGCLNEFEDQHSRYLDGGPGKISPFVIPKMIANAAQGTVSINYGLSGPNTSVSSACASAALAIGDAVRAVLYVYADVMITGGSESCITPMGL